jgi:hypothetical protein
MHSSGRRAHDTFSSPINIDCEIVRECLEFEGKRAIRHCLLDSLQDIKLVPQLIEHILDGGSIGLRSFPTDHQLDFPHRVST